MKTEDWVIVGILLWLLLQKPKPVEDVSVVLTYDLPEDDFVSDVITGWDPVRGSYLDRSSKEWFDDVLA